MCCICCFLLVQSAGLFGGPDYLAAKGISLRPVGPQRFFPDGGCHHCQSECSPGGPDLLPPARRGWGAVRLLAGALIAESLVLLASAAWRMSLYVSVYGLSFKRLMTYWGMGMMALFLLAALWKLLRPNRSFCRAAFPIAPGRGGFSSTVSRWTR